jgi:hypothetical protein
MPGDDRRVTGRAAENNARGSAHWLGVAQELDARVRQLDAELQATRQSARADALRGAAKDARVEAKRVGHYPTNAALHFHHFADFLESLASDNEGKA